MLTLCALAMIASILMLDQELVPKSVFLRNWGPSIRDCFAILEPYIRDMQKPENSGPEYWDDFVRLVDACNGVSNPAKQKGVA